MPQNRFKSIMPMQRATPLLVIFLLVSACFYAHPVFAKKKTGAEVGARNLVAYLHQEQRDLLRENSENSLLIEPTNVAMLHQKMNENAALFALNQAKIESLEGFLVNQRQNQKLLAFKIKKATLAPNLPANDPLIKTHLAKLIALNDENNQIIALINDNLSEARCAETILLNGKRQLEEWRIKKSGMAHLQELQQKIDVLIDERSLLYEKSAQLQRDKKNNLDFNQTYDEAFKLQLNNHRIALINAQMNFLQLQNRLIRTDELLTKQHDIKTIISTIDTDKDTLQQLNLIDQTLLKMVALIKDEQLYAGVKESQQKALSLEAKVGHFLQEVAQYHQKISESLVLKQQELKKQLSVRQTLASYQVSSWSAFKTELSRAPFQAESYLTAFAYKLKEGYFRLSHSSRVLLGMSLFLITLLGVLANRQLKRMTQDKTRSRLSAHLYDGVLVLLARNAVPLILMMGFMAVFLALRIPFAHYRLIVLLFLVWLIFKNLILIARMTLLERVYDTSGKDARFYYRLKRLLMVGVVITLLMVFSQQLPLSILIQDVLTRFFMFFLFSASFVMWASKDIFPILLYPVLKKKKRYLRNAISLLFILLPLTLFTTAVIGLIGYMNLAWSMSRYQAYLVLVIVAYVLVRGLLSDALELISEWMISSLRNGWLWVEVFLKPLDKITHLFLFLVSVILLFQLFGVYTEMPVLLWLKHLGHYELVDVSGVHITLNSTLEFLIVVSLFVWIAKWTREFCYRWLYRHSRDEGVRNSLSVFTQYAVILSGSYITLRVLGLEFSGMSMVLGGLAVGMGFGLRDFASNIVGGIMLLIERPVREGDLITLGEYEGRVAHIGIRSMRVSSWDNTEVLIPNAETFNKPFINWTHQDSVVRTVVPIKVSREDDPSLIQRLIFEVLSIIPEILDEPASQVFLKQIDDALIEFEVRYFINVQTYTRFEVRSKFLFALTAQFKAAGIKPPIPPLSVELKESSSDYVVAKKPTAE